MNKILITGGIGFIGTEIVKQLNALGKYEIIVLDSMSEQIHGQEWEDSYLYKQIKSSCMLIKEDIRNFEAVQHALESVDVVLHLAAETGTGQSMYMINQYNSVNIMGTSNLIQAISLMDQKKRPQKIILSSSRSVYGEGDYECPNCGKIYPKGRSVARMREKDFKMYCEQCGEKVRLIPTSEDSIPRPNSLYAFTKYTQEKMIETMCPALGVDYTIFRFQNVYGVGQSLKNPYTGILSIFSTLMLENKSINIFEDGMESRDFINVVDVAAAVIKSIENENSNAQIINLGSGEAVSVLEIARILKEKYECNSEINITGDFRIGDIAHNIADITKAKEILGFEQTVSIDEGITKFCNWVKNQEFDNSMYENSLSEMENAGMFIRRK